MKILYIIIGVLLGLLIRPHQVMQAEVPLVAPVAPFPAILERIATCESQNNPHAKNKYSSASGRFQFLWSSWNYYGKQLWGEDFYEKNIWSYEDNTELALYVYKLNGTKDWNESKHCWQTKDV